MTFKQAKTSEQHINTLENAATRRRALTAIGASLIGAGFPGLALSQSYPSRPLRVVVPLPAGASPDVVARHWAERFSKLTSQSVVIENKPGASTILGAQTVATSAPDGYTLLWAVSNTFSVNPFLFKNLSYQANDFIPITQVLAVPFVLLVPANSPWRTLDDLIRSARGKPEEFAYASAGTGTSLHVAMARFLNAADIKMTHVPYRDSYMPDLIAGRIHAVFDPSTTGIAAAKGGRVRALGVSSTKRIEQLPDVPAISEQIPGFVGESWQGVFVPRSTPTEVVNSLSGLAQKVAESPDFRNVLSELGLRPVGSTPSAFGQFLVDDARAWSKVVKDNGITAD